VTDQPTLAVRPPSGSAEEAAGEPAEQLGRAFKAALAALRRMRGREHRCGGLLSDAQYSLLFCLRDRDRLSSTELAQDADLSPASVTEMLDALAHAGLVERTRSDRDRRVVLTSLTERGHALVEARRAEVEPRFRAALKEFSDDDLLIAAAVLDRLRGMFDEFAEERAAAGGDQALE
jgi:DNA-binding MarR family transcriptional regulator